MSHPGIFFVNFVLFKQFTINKNFILQAVWNSDSWSGSRAYWRLDNYNGPITKLVLVALFVKLIFSTCI